MSLMPLHTETCTAMNKLASPGAEESVNIVAANWNYSTPTNSSFVADIYGNNNNNNDNNNNDNNENNNNNYKHSKHKGLF